MALPDTLKQFNWVDIFFVILFMRVCYVAIKNGFFAELFRLLGVISAIYISFHYYINLSDYVGTFMGSKNMPLEYLSFFSFLVLVFAGYFIFALIGRFFSRFFKAEAAPRLNRWGSFILGIFRSLLLISLIVFIFLVAPVGYFRNSIASSYSGKRLVMAAPAAYTWLWESVVSKFRPQEKFNDTVVRIQESLTKQ